MGMPWALRKVKVMAPPMRMASALPKKCRMMSILSETLLPPMTARRGFSGSVMTLPRALSSFSMRKPATARPAGMKGTMPLTEAWARWEAPKASST